MITITTTDLAGNSATRNYTIKVDKNSPTLTAKSSNVTITQGSSNAVSNYFTVSYGISGESLSCSPSNTSSLATGTRNVSCTATGGNGKSTTKSISIKVESEKYIYWTDTTNIYRVSATATGQTYSNKQTVYTGRANHYPTEYFAVNGGSKPIYVPN